MSARSPSFDGLDDPTVVQQFRVEPIRAPRSLAERLFDLRGWRDEAVGGHFGAWEQPEAYVAGVRDALALA